MNQKMTLYDYAYRDVWYSNYSDGIGSYFRANIRDMDSDVLKANEELITFICSEHPDVSYKRPYVCAKENCEDVLENVRQKLQKHFIVSPLVWMPNDEHETELTRMKELNHRLGFIIGYWERIDRLPNEDRVISIITHMNDETKRIYANRGELAEFIEARKRLDLERICCGSIIADESIDASHDYFMDVNIRFSDFPELDDCVTAQEATDVLAKNYGLEHNKEKHMLLWFKEGFYTSEAPVPDLIKRIRDALTRFTTVSPVSFIYMESDEHEELKGDIIYFSYGITQEDKNRKNIDILDMYFYMD